MDTDTILGLLDETARLHAFESCLKTLELAPRLELEALRVCVKLHPPLKTAPGGDRYATPLQDQNHTNVPKDIVDGPALTQRLCHLLVSRIPHEPLDSDHFYKLADVLCGDGRFANLIFRETIHANLVALLPELTQGAHRDTESTEAEAQAERTATAYLTLIKCSCWLPSSHNHVIDLASLGLLSQFMGLPSIGHVAHDAISAFLSLLRRGERIVVASPSGLSQSWLKLNPISGHMELSGSIIDGSLWDQLRVLEINSRTMGEWIKFATSIFCVYRDNTNIYGHVSAVFRSSSKTLHWLTSDQVNLPATYSEHGSNGSRRLSKTRYY
jgi:tRNA guanosine-2'-O-methyltransferase